MTARSQHHHGSMLRDSAVLLAFVMFCVSVVLVTTGVLQVQDEEVLLSLRVGEDPARVRAPELVTSAVLLLTEGGGHRVLVPLSLLTALFLSIRKRRAEAATLLLAGVSGLLLNEGMKQLFARARPVVVPALSDVTGLSFPSGHAMMSAIIYGLLAYLLVPRALPQARRRSIWVMTGVLVLLVGLSRPYLGVHYLTDVVGGWSIGVLWLLLWIRLLRFWPRRESGSDRA